MFIIYPRSKKYPHHQTEQDQPISSFLLTERLTIGRDDLSSGGSEPVRPVVCRHDPCSFEGRALPHESAYASLAEGSVLRGSTWSPPAER